MDSEAEHFFGVSWIGELTWGWARERMVKQKQILESREIGGSVKREVFAVK